MPVDGCRCWPPDTGGVTERSQAIDLDEQDELAPLRDSFYRPDPDLLYLDGNSLGMMPLAVQERLHRMVDDEWGRELVRGWQHWDSLPMEAGDRIGQLIGAAPGQVVVTDTIFDEPLQAGSCRARGPAWAQGAGHRQRQLPLRPLRPAGRRGAAQGPAASGADRPDERRESGRRAHLSCRRRRDGLVLARRLPIRCHQRHCRTDRAGTPSWGTGARSTSPTRAGAVPIELDAMGVDFAVGCTYKYLNAGPGAPAFLYVRRDLQSRLANPIQGWWGVADPFDMDAPFTAADGIARWQTGTPPVPGLVAVDESVALAGRGGYRPAARQVDARSRRT